MSETTGAEAVVETHAGSPTPVREAVPEARAPIRRARGTTLAMLAQEDDAPTFPEPAPENRQEHVEASAPEGAGTDQKGSPVENGEAMAARHGTAAPAAAIVVNTADGSAAPTAPGPITPVRPTPARRGRTMMADMSDNEEDLPPVGPEPGPLLEQPADTTADAHPSATGVTGEDPKDPKDPNQGFSPPPKGEDGRPALPPGMIPDPAADTGADSTKGIPPSAAPGTDPADSGPASIKPPEQDDFPKYQTDDDPVHARFMQMLTAPRQDHLTRLAAETGVLQQQAQRMQNADSARQANSPPKQGPGGPGGGGGGGVGTMVGAALRFAALPVTAPGRLVADAVRDRKATNLQTRINNHGAFKETVLDRQYAAMTNAADAMYRDQSDLADRIKRFNGRFFGSPKGEDFVRSLEDAATRAGSTQSAMRSRIHDASDTDQDVTALRAKATALCADPEFADDMREIEKRARSLRVNADAFHGGLSKLADNGVDMKGINGIGEVMDEMVLPDAALAVPGGERVDQVQDRMEKIRKAVRELVERVIQKVQSVFGGPRA